MKYPQKKEIPRSGGQLAANLSEVQATAAHKMLSRCSLLSKQIFRTVQTNFVRGYKCVEHNPKMKCFELMGKGKEQLFCNHSPQLAMSYFHQTIDVLDPADYYYYDAKLLTAVCLQKMNQKEAANHVFEEILSKVNPNCKYSLLATAEAKRNTKEFPIALERTLKAIQIDKYYTRARLLLANILLYEYDQFEMSASHTEIACRSVHSCDPDMEHNTYSELYHDPYYSIRDYEPPIPLDDTLMNFPSILFKENINYEEENSFYRKAMGEENSANDLPTAVFKKDSGELGVQFPNNNFGLDFISTELYENIPPLMPYRQDKKKDLDSLIGFAKNVKNRNNIVVLAAETEEEREGKWLPEYESSDSDNDRDVDSQWISIAHALGDGQWKFGADPSLAGGKKLKIPDSWKIFYERHFTKKQDFIPRSMYYYTPLLENAICKGCQNEVPGIRAMDLTYHATATPKCFECGEEYYSPQKTAHPPNGEARDHVELPLLEKTARSVWQCDGLVVLGNYTDKAPWVDMINIAHAKSTPILFIGKVIPSHMAGEKNIFPVSSPSSHSFPHLKNEIDYFTYNS